MINIFKTFKKLLQSEANINDKILESILREINGMQDLQYGSAQDLERLRHEANTIIRCNSDARS